jgi:coenzyme F420-0:L-glutamate ligase/coenzyme F420-1:gamma-L-glutamate ligase
MLVESMKKENLTFEDGDILAIASKALSAADGRFVQLKKISPSEKAKKLAKKYSLAPEFVELILEESDRVYDGVYKAILTLKNNILTVNAGIDQKNAPIGYVALWPLNPQSRANQIRNEIQQRLGKKMGVLIIDSQVAPLRIGTRGIALAVSGFKPVNDLRGRKDLYGKELLITRHSVADDLASTAHLIMGESDEKVPAVLIRDAPVVFTEENINVNDMIISPEECVFMSGFHFSAKSNLKL